MPPKRLKMTMSGEVVSSELPLTYKAKPKVYIELEWLVRYREQRNQIIWDKFPESRQDIMNLREQASLGIIGVKSAPKAKIVKESEDKPRKHEEISLQAQFCNWVKKEYPDIKFLRHEREKARSNFMGNQMKVMNSAGSMPDWETTEVIGNYTGLLIEFKKPGEKWLLKDNVTVKPAYAHQYACHLGLWKQRRVVYFCNDLEIAKIIIQQYLQGRTMRQRIYKFPAGYEHLAA